MTDSKLNVLIVVGSQNSNSITRVVLEHAGRLLQGEGCSVDMLDLGRDPLPLYNPETSHEGPDFAQLQARVEGADVFLLGTPDYHGSISSTLKNFLDHFWHEFAGKLFATVVASHEKGLTVTDQLRTVARQCNAWTLPYGISLAENVDVKNGQIVNEAFAKRLEMLTRDARVYGGLIADQRRSDLECQDTCFMARHRQGKSAG